MQIFLAAGYDEIIQCRDGGGHSGSGAKDGFGTE